MKKNRLCDLLGIRYPILQGGMLWLADARLAAAVSNAGALGTLSSYAGMQPNGDPFETLRRQIQKTRELTPKPFAVNIPLSLPMSGLLVDVLLQEKVAVAVTAAGNPGIYTELLKSSGILVFHVIGSVSQARTAEICGVDAVVVEGVEAGGRLGREEIPLFPLLSQVTGTVSLPAVAAGGIADGRGMAAAFAHGASGVQMGTRFIATPECPAHPDYKKAIIQAGDGDTVVTRRSTTPIRSLKSAFIRELEAMEQSGATADQIEDFIGRNRAWTAQVAGDIDSGDAYAGTSAGKIREILPVNAVIRKMIREYQETRKRVSSPCSEDL